MGHHLPQFAVARQSFHDEKSSGKQVI